MTAPADSLSEPLMDTPVVSSDGQQLGYVKEVQGGYFKLDVPMSRDFWLSCAYIADNSMDAVRLNLRRDEVDEHRLSEVPTAVLQENDAVISDAEALSQREKMERELEMQRERMRSGQV